MIELVVSNKTSFHNGEPGTRCNVIATQFNKQLCVGNWNIQAQFKQGKSLTTRTWRDLVTGSWSMTSGCHPYCLKLAAFLNAVFKLSRLPLLCCRHKRSKWTEPTGARYGIKRIVTCKILQPVVTGKLVLLTIHKDPSDPVFRKSSNAKLPRHVDRLGHRRVLKYNFYPLLLYVLSASSRRGKLLTQPYLIICKFSGGCLSSIVVCIIILGVHIRRYLPRSELEFLHYAFWSKLHCWNVFLLMRNKNCFLLAWLMDTCVLQDLRSQQHFVRDTFVPS